jgi:hypothetical protein
MEEWTEELKEKLMSYDYQVELADLCRVLGLSTSAMP